MTKRAVVAVVAIALVVLWQARLRRGEPSQESAAIGAMRAIGSGQSDYAATVGHGGYAGSLATLATPCAGTSRAFVSPDLASDPTFKDGYTISLRPKPAAQRVSSDCNGAATYSGYYAIAKPTSPTREKRRAFATDETGSIWFDVNGIPPRPPFDGRVLR